MDVSVAEGDDARGGDRVFREKSLEVIVDMLSDEIETVRLAAVRALYRIRNHIHLSSTHLQVQPPRLFLPQSDAMMHFCKDMLPSMLGMWSSTVCERCV